MRKRAKAEEIVRNGIDMVSNMDDIKYIAEHVATTIYGTHSRDIMLALEGQFGISAMFDVRTKNPIKDIEGNDIEIIEMLFHEGLTSILIPTIRFGITDSNNKLISTDIKEFTEITLKKDAFRNTLNDIVLRLLAFLYLFI